VLVRVRFTVEENYAGWRLDRYLQQKILRLSRARIQKLI
jgi:23S rRNA pseudouridine1911/1915/1917 synthase